MAGLARDGYNMIFATSFGELELGVNGQLYAKYPKILFEQERHRPLDLTPIHPVRLRLGFV